MKLAMELIPAPCWGQTLQDRIGADWWRTLEEQVLRDARGICAVCGTLATLQLDERWRYGDTRATRTLIAVEALCALCFHGRHYGLASVLADQGLLDLAAVEEHFGMEPPFTVASPSRTSWRGEPPNASSWSNFRGMRLISTQSKGAGRS
jgi:hypothetical protein